MGGYILISVLILITCILLTLVVLVQNSKGGGLASNFSGSNQFMGVRKTADFLEKSTWTLAIILLVLSLSTSFVIPRRQAGEQVTQSAISEEAQQSAPPVDPNYTMPPGQEQLPPQPQEN